MNATQGTSSAASVEETATAINDACKRLGGVYSRYSCQYVSWDDSSRTQTITTQNSSGLSCWGNNISDTYLKAKHDGRKFFTVRPPNWNETLGTVAAADLAVLVGNHQQAGALRPVTLRDVLQHMGEYGNYAGIPRQTTLLAETLDQHVSIRFQTTFLPAASNNPTAAGPFGSGNTNNPFSHGPFGGSPTQQATAIEFATEVYNYQTSSERDPKNLILLCTTQGLAVQQDGPSTTRLYHHVVKQNASLFGTSNIKPTVHRHWLEAERTQHAVGGPQHETPQEKADALARGKATSAVIGPRPLGQRFNVLMTIQVPLKQKTSLSSSPGLFGQPTVFGCKAPPMVGFAQPSFSTSPIAQPFGGFGSTTFGNPAPAPLFSGAPSAPLGGFGPTGGMFATAVSFGAPAPANATFSGFGCHSNSFLPSAPLGVSNAARVSLGSQHDVWHGLKADSFERHPTERITATVVIYNIVAGGVPTQADVVAAIDDLEMLYAACRGQDRSASSTFNNNPWPFVSNTVASPRSQPVINGGIFPEPHKPIAPIDATAIFAPMSDIPASVTDKCKGLPATKETIHYLVTLGNTLLNNPSSNILQLYESFCFFRLGNDLSVQLRGVQDVTHVYNVACACCRMSTRTTDVLPFATTTKLPGWCHEPKELRQASLSWLVAAVGAGWRDVNHMKVDPDLQAVRASHPAAFAVIVQLAQYC